jgi:dihydroorotate dehydrogenase
MSKITSINPSHILKIAGSTFKLLEPYLYKAPLDFTIALNSIGRKIYEKKFYDIQPKKTHFNPGQEFSRTMWGLNFRLPLSNAAGSFKNGDGYDLVAKLGAGAYIGGTSTFNPRNGNIRDGLHLPFVKLPKSRTSINFLGLPNLGDEVLSKKIYTKNKIDGCPIGWSVMRSPDYSLEESQEKLVRSLFLYQNNPLVDFMEINESCPNVKQSNTSNIFARLDNISEEFLKKRKRHLPVLVKLSTDVSESCLIEILKEMVRLGFDGINLGNTSTNYENILENISDQDKKLFQYFTTKYGGGVGGRALKNKSIQLCKVAKRELNKLNLNREFHIIRTGGVENPQDVIESEESGVSLNQWHTGFFYNYLNHGNNVYKFLFEEITRQMNKNKTSVLSGISTRMTI